MLLLWKQIAPSNYRALCEDISSLYRGKEGGEVASGRERVSVWAFEGEEHLGQYRISNRIWEWGRENYLKFFGHLKGRISYRIWEWGRENLFSFPISPFLISQFFGFPVFRFPGS